MLTYLYDFFLEMSLDSTSFHSTASEHNSYETYTKFIVSYTSRNFADSPFNIQIICLSLLME